MSSKFFVASLTGPLFYCMRTSSRTSQFFFSSRDTKLCNFSFIIIALFCYTFSRLVKQSQINWFGFRLQRKIMSSIKLENVDALILTHSNPRNEFSVLESDDWTGKCRRTNWNIFLIHETNSVLLRVMSREQQVLLLTQNRTQLSEKTLNSTGTEILTFSNRSKIVSDSWYAPELPRNNSLYDPSFFWSIEKVIKY